MTESARRRQDVALVTGGGRGFGRAVALALADAGFAVAIVGRSSPALVDTTKLLSDRGVEAMHLSADVRDANALQRSVFTIENQLGPIGVLVNNAGTEAALGPLWQADPEQWWSDVETSLRGAFNACHAVLPSMIARGRGRILNVGSDAGVRAAPYESGYAAGKAALLSLTEALAASLADMGIVAFAISPGFVWTDLTRHLADSDDGRRWLPGISTREALDIDLGARLAVRVALGEADALSGRFLHALDDVDALLGRIGEIEREELYVARVRRLSDTG